MKTINKFKSYMDGWRDKEDFINTLIYIKNIEGERLDIFLNALMNKIDNPNESNLLVPNGLRNLLVKNFLETCDLRRKNIKVNRFKEATENE